MTTSNDWTIKDLNRLSQIFSKYDLSQGDWRISPIGDDSIDVWFDCSDTFFWATAEGESVFPSDIPDLEQAAFDLNKAFGYGVVYFDILWASRKRGLKPMERWLTYEASEPEIRALFDAIEVKNDKD